MNTTLFTGELTWDAIQGLSRALGFHERAIDEAISKGGDPEAMKDILDCLHAAKSWLMTISRERY